MRKLLVEVLVSVVLTFGVSSIFAPCRTAAPAVPSIACEACIDVIVPTSLQLHGSAGIGVDLTTVLVEGQVTSPPVAEVACYVGRRKSQMIGSLTQLSRYLTAIMPSAVSKLPSNASVNAMYIFVINRPIALYGPRLQTGRVLGVGV